MTSGNGATIIDLSVSHLDKEALVASFDDDPDLKSSLEAATVLILPTHLGPEHDGPVFPSATQEIFHRLRDGLKETAVVDAAIRDEDYVEYRYRSDAILIPALFVGTVVLLPMVVNILSSYIYDHLRNRGKKGDDAHVECDIHFVNEEKGIQSCFRYKGPATTFEKVALKSLGDDQSDDC